MLHRCGVRSRSLHGCPFKTLCRRSANVPYQETPDYLPNRREDGKLETPLFVVPPLKVKEKDRSTMQVLFGGLHFYIYNWCTAKVPNLFFKLLHRLITSAEGRIMTDVQVVAKKLWLVPLASQC